VTFVSASTPDVRRLLAGLDPQQVLAVTTDAAPLAVIAAAGSGKTTVLTRRIAHRVATGSADPARVLALTFTRDAAGELRRRLRQLAIEQPVEAGTFHSVALRLLTDRALAANAAPPQVAPDRLRLVRECVTELRLTVAPSGALADIDWARARLVSPVGYAAASRAARRRSAIAADRFVDLVAAYERLKQRRGVIDFDDLLARLVNALHTDEQWADAMRWRYRHFFVDEAQDLNPLQHAMLEALRGGRGDLCLVGDPRQAIYGWNGAEPQLLVDVEQTYPGVTIVRLGANYRCTPQVVRAGAAVLAAAGQADDTRSERPEGAAVVVRRSADATVEAQTIAGHVRALVAQRGASEVAVLARTNDQLAPIERALAAAGVPVERAAGRSALERTLTATQRMSREQLAAWVAAVFAGPDDISIEQRGGAIVDHAIDDPHDPDDGSVVRRVAEEADRYLTAAAPGTFRAWLEARSPFDDLHGHHTRSAVALLTFHAAKGREWGAVVVAGADDGLVPHASATSAAQLAEEARLFYVALTRAGEHLLVTHTDQRDGRTTGPSRWLAAVASAGVEEPIAAPPSRRARAVDPMTPYREWRAAVARAAGQQEAAVCSDRVLRSLAESPPLSSADLARRLGITESAAQRLRPLPQTA
jgi:DNA helicase-2/ATP-dependent DNA helicase PcrA